MITSLGIVLVVIGAVTLAASSGAFDSAVADRSTAVETTDDGSALLGLKYSNGDSIELERADSDGGGFCFGQYCLTDFRYNDVEIVLLEDNTPPPALTIEEVSLDIDNEDMIRGDELRHEATSDGLRIVLGDFGCPVEGTSGNWGTGTQVEDSGTITITVEASDGNLTITLEREVTVECVEE